MTADLLLLEDDKDYASAVAGVFSAREKDSGLQLHRSVNVQGALQICRERDIRVAIIDLALSDGSAGTDAIREIWEFDKKIVFLIHTIHSVETASRWTAEVPYTAQFFLQKSGGGTDQSRQSDAAALHALAAKAVRSYVPHIPPVVVSVRDLSQAIAGYSERHPAFRRAAILNNIHHSQDVMNRASQWASDRLSRTGFDANQIAVALTGSFARFEATTPSDADYFVVFDDANIPGRRLQEMVNLAYHSFLETGAWFERAGVPVHDFRAPERTPGGMRWHETTLPTWFPVSALRNAKLGRTTQLEVTKLWFLFESAPIFNTALVADIRTQIAAAMGIAIRPTVRDGIAHSSLVESYRFLCDEFQYGFRHWPRTSLAVLKQYFMRELNLFSLRLWLLRAYLDPTIYEKPASQLFEFLSPHPLVRLIEFREFLLRETVLAGAELESATGMLDAICNAYAEAAHVFGLEAMRADNAAADSALINDLADRGRQCQQHCDDIVRLLSKSRAVRNHFDLAALQLV